MPTDRHYGSALGYPNHNSMHWTESRCQGSPDIADDCGYPNYSLESGNLDFFGESNFLYCATNMGTSAPRQSYPGPTLRVPINVPYVRTSLTPNLGRGTSLLNQWGFPHALRELIGSYELTKPSCFRIIFSDLGTPSDYCILNYRIFEILYVMCRNCSGTKINSTNSLQTIPDRHGSHFACLLQILLGNHSVMGDPVMAQLNNSLVSPCYLPKAVISLARLMLYTPEYTFVYCTAKLS